MIPKIVQLGYKGERNARSYVFNVADELERWAGTAPTVMHRRPSDTQFYPTTSTLEGTMLTWVFSKADLKESGYGEAYIKFESPDGEIVGKTKIFETNISRSGDETEEVPPPVKEWSDKVAADAAMVQIAIDDFKQGIEQGRYKGDKGDDGYTPIKGVDYFDGENGKDGKNGADGKDGYTPVKGIDYFDGKDGKDAEPYDDTEIRGQVSQLKSDITDQDDRITELENRPVVDKSLTERVEKLEAAAEGNLYMFREDAEDAYEKPVPSDAMKWATLDKVGGKTIVWNQLIKPVNNRGSKVEKGLTVTNNNDGTITLNGTTEGLVTYRFQAYFDNGATSVFQGHKYIIPFVDISVGLYARIETVNGGFNVTTPIFTSTLDGTFSCDIRMDTGHTYTNVTIPGVFFDLTAMFGAGNEPTAEEFRAMFPADYYPYSEPTLMSYEPDKVVSKGRNLMTLANTEGSKEKSGIKYIKDDDWFIFDGTATASHTYIFDELNVAKGKYLLSIDGNYSFSASIGLYIRDVKNGVNIGYISLTNAKSTTFTLDDDVENLRIYMIPQSGTTAHGSIRLSMTKGDKVFPYAPYRAPITTDLSPIVSKYFPDGMKSAGDVHDEIDLQRGVSVQMVGKFTTDISYIWKSNGSSETAIEVYAEVNFDTKSYGYISNENFAYKGTKAAISPWTVNQRIGTSGLRFVTISLPKTIVDDANDAVDWCNKNPQTFYYELSTSIETPIDPADLAGLTELNVEAGGSLTFVNQHGDDYRVQLPNQETFMIKLGGAQA